MAQEHLNALVEAAGIEKADFDAIMALPAETKDFKAEDYTSKIRGNYETQIKNDPKFWEGLDENNINPAFQKKIESQQYGRAANIVRQKALKAFGMKEEDFADLSEDDKKNVEVFISKAAEKYALTKTGDKQLQKDLVEARKKLEDLETDIPTREGKIKQDYDMKFNDKTLDFIFLSQLSEIANDKETPLKVPASYVFDKLASFLKENNAFVVNGLNATPKQKANPTLDILEGSKALTTKDLMVKKLKADGLIGEPDKPDSQKGRMKVDIIPDGTGGLQMSSHVQSMIDANKPA